MSKDADIEHFQGALDPHEHVKGGHFVQAARIVAGEAGRARGVFTFIGYTPSASEPSEVVLETSGRYERVDNVIRVFFDNPPDHSEEVSLSETA